MTVSVKTVPKSLPPSQDPKRKREFVTIIISATPTPLHPLSPHSQLSLDCILDSPTTDNLGRIKRPGPTKPNPLPIQVLAVQIEALGRVSRAIDLGIGQQFALIQLGPIDFKGKRICRACEVPAGAQAAQRVVVERGELEDVSDRRVLLCRRVAFERVPAVRRWVVV